VKLVYNPARNPPGDFRSRTFDRIHVTQDDKEQPRPTPRERGETAPRVDAEVVAGADDSDTRFLSFAENASDAILIIDDESVIRFANRAAEDIFGYAVDELRGESLTLLMPEYLRHVHRAGVARYLETGTKHISWRGVELPGLHRDGRELELEISFGEFVRDGRRHFTGIARDISERKRAERARAVQHAVTRALVSTVGVSATVARVLRAVGEIMHWEVAEFWEVDAGEGVLRCEESWHTPPINFGEFEETSHARTFRRGDGLPGRVWAGGAAEWIEDVTLDDNFPRAHVAAREGIRAGFAFPVSAGGDVLGVMEFFSREARAPDEELRAAMSSVGSLLGQLIERKRAEESLHRAEGSQRFLANASELLASSLDYETTLASVARLAVPYLADWCLIDLRDGDEITRVAVAHADAAKVEAVWEAVRRTPVDARPSEGVAKVIRTGRAELLTELTEPILAAAFPDPEKLRLVRGLGLRSAMLVPMVAHERTLGAISFASAESGRRYTRADLALAEDLARRAALAVDNARLYREAQEVNRLKDEFLATLSHELRTPLTAILGWAGLLRSVKLDDETAASALETIERNARSQKQLIDDLLDASRIITGKLRLEAKPTRLAPVVAAAVESMRPAAASKGVDLSVALDGGALVVAGDAERLQQIVWNLLSNAVKFTPPEGRIEVALAREGDGALISVSDTGVGIAPEFLPLVFERFRQADASTTRAFGGLGLGLSIVRHLVDLHGGRVTTESEGVGRGATFRVRLPLVADDRSEATVADSVASSSASAQGDAKQKLSGKRVLVVDDDADTLVMLRKTLERYGAGVETCDSVAAALRTLDGSPAFDVLVSDIGMPVEDGYTLMRRIVERARERGSARLPALALTAYARREDHDAALAAGFDAHIAKPVAPAELVEAVAKLASSAPKV
jgi:PAS domain S-box-containing protein